MHWDTTPSATDVEPLACGWVLLPAQQWSAPAFFVWPPIDALTRVSRFLAEPKRSQPHKGNLVGMGRKVADTLRFRGTIGVASR